LSLKKYKITEKKDPGFGGWGGFVDFATGEALRPDKIIEAKNAKEARQKASAKYNIPLDSIVVEEVKE